MILAGRLQGLSLIEREGSSAAWSVDHLAIMRSFRFDATIERQFLLVRSRPFEVIDHDHLRLGAARLQF